MDRVEELPMLKAVAKLCVLLMIGCGPSLISSQTQSAQPAEVMTHATAPAGPLKITYAEKAEEWTPTMLAPLAHTTITVYNEHAKINQTFTGVPLIDLLARLGVPTKPRGKDFQLYLVAGGSDGYQVVYSLGEISPDVHDGTVLVADGVDGHDLGNNGFLQLVATGEKRPARWVRNLIAIRVLNCQ
jgi:hypothetical protein